MKHPADDTMGSGPSVRFLAGVLRNDITMRFHPIVFYPSPMPCGKGEFDMRHLSKGHHVNGFDTREEAEAFINTQPTLLNTFMLWPWDGVKVPALAYVSLRRSVPASSAGAPSVSAPFVAEARDTRSEPAGGDAR